MSRAGSTNDRAGLARPLDSAGGRGRAADASAIAERRAPTGRPARGTARGCPPRPAPASTSWRRIVSIRSASCTIPCSISARCSSVIDVPALLERVAEPLHRRERRADVVRRRGDDRLERLALARHAPRPIRTGTRWPRRRGSATRLAPRAGPARVASASASDVLGQAVRLVAEHERDRARRGPCGRGRSPPSAAIARIAESAIARRRSIAAAVSTPRTTGRWKSDPADERTVFGLYTSTEVRGEHDAVGARRVGRAEHRPGVPGIAHLVQDRDAPVGGKRVELDVEERRHADEPLRASRWT